MNNTKSLKVNAVLNTMKTVLGIIFPLITFPYVSRVLGVDNIGSYNFSASIISYFSLIAALGIATYGIREGAKYRDTEEITDFINEVFSINIIATLLAYMLLAMVVALVPTIRSHSVIIAILSIEIFATTIGAAWICNVYEDFFFIAVRSLLVQFISLILTFALVKTADDLYKYVSIAAFASSGANIWNLFYIRKKYCKYRFTTKINWNRHIKPILIIFSTNVAITIYVSSDATMLGFMVSDYEVGLYTTAVKIYTIIKSVLAAMLMVLIPRFSILFEQESKDELNKLFSSVFGFLNVLMLPMVVGLFVISDDVVLLIAGAKFTESGAPLRLLSVAILFSLYSYLYTQCILIPAKREDVVFKATMASAVVNILLNFILIPVWGKNAAATTTIIAECITFIIAIRASGKYVEMPRIDRTITSSIVGCIAIAIVCYIAKSIALFVPRLALSLFGSAIIYFVILLLMKNPVINNIIRSRIKS